MDSQAIDITHFAAMFHCHFKIKALETLRRAFNNL